MQINKLNKTLGVFGGGQLGKMIGLAAANLGIGCYFYDPDKNAPAKKISQVFFNYSFDNEKKLIEFAKNCDFITYEFENILSSFNINISTAKIPITFNSLVIFLAMFFAFKIHFFDMLAG